MLLFYPKRLGIGYSTLVGERLVARMTDKAPVDARKVYIQNAEGVVTVGTGHGIIIFANRNINSHKADAISSPLKQPLANFILPLLSLSCDGHSVKSFFISLSNLVVETRMSRST